MSDEKSTPENGANWRQLLKEQGKQAFELAEMQRLGFWPPDEATARTHEQTHAELAGLREQMTPLRKCKTELEKEIAAAGNVPALLAEVRRKRIERVRLARAERKILRAAQALEKAERDRQWRAQTLPHLGRDVSQGLKYEGGDDEKLTSLGLPVLHSAQQVAASLEISTGQLAWLTYHRRASSIDHYNHWTIPKKSGGRRTISAPKEKLRAAQDWLLQNVLGPVPVHQSAMAFRPRTSIAHNAHRHVGSAIVLRLDLKDFFPSIGFRRVKRALERLGYNEGVATIFALICTEAPRVELTLDGQKHFVALADRFLPQGAPTSPALTNILCEFLDKRLDGAARKLGFAYTRYADDLIFSSRDAKANAVSMRDLATKILADEKFVVNDEKTAIMRRRNRQTVTGIVINDGENLAPRLSREDARRFRAFLHSYEKLGREAMTEKLGQDALSYAQGYLSFVHMVNPEQAEKFKARHAWLERK